MVSSRKAAKAQSNNTLDLLTTEAQSSQRDSFKIDLLSQSR